MQRTGELLDNTRDAAIEREGAPLHLLHVISDARYLIRIDPLHPSYLVEHPDRQINREHAMPCGKSDCRNRRTVAYQLWPRRSITASGVFRRPFREQSRADRRGRSGDLARQ